VSRGRDDGRREKAVATLVVVVVVVVGGYKLAGAGLVTHSSRKRRAASG